MQRHGLYIPPNRTNREATYCHLERVFVHATIKDASCLVKIEQVYINGSKKSFPEARYAFPVPDGAAVSSFTLTKEDGTQVHGVVKEKEEAKKTFEKAQKEGKFAGLMAQRSADVFELAVGNLPALSRTTVALSYITSLPSPDEALDSLRLSLPTSISARYGPEPESTLPLNDKARHLGTQGAFLRVKVDVESSLPVKSVSSPSHSTSTTLGPPEGRTVAPEKHANYATVELTADAPLDKNFVITVTAGGVDTPTCLAEIRPTTEGEETLAIGLSLVPRFELKDVQEMEYLFVVDRSGSMGGWAESTGRIGTARKALVVMLRSLPKKGTSFNIISFGSHNDALWKSSRIYDQQSLDLATKHVDTMQADYGGTEIQSALQTTLKVRRGDRPTAIFLLTDGDAWQLDETLKTVEAAIKKEKDEGQLRIFTLAIGESSSSALCTGLARVGNGVAYSVMDNEPFTGKTARMLKAAKTPLIKDLRIDWGVPASSLITERMDEDFELVSKGEGSGAPAATEKVAKLSLFDTGANPLADDKKNSKFEEHAPVALPPVPAVQQAPSKLRPLYPGSRSNVHVILRQKAGSGVPSKVTIHGRIAETDQEVEFAVPVFQSSSAAAGEAPIHTVAARMLIQELEDKTRAADEKYFDDPASIQSRTVKAEMVRLGTTYSIASTHTSFVAVDESKPATKDDATEKEEAISSDDEDYDLTTSAGLYGAAPGSTMPAAVGYGGPPPTSGFGRAMPRMKSMATRGGGGGWGGAPPPPPMAMMAAPAPMLMSQPTGMAQCFAGAPAASYPGAAAAESFAADGQDDEGGAASYDATTLSSSSPRLHGSVSSASSFGEKKKKGSSGLFGGFVGSVLSRGEKSDGLAKDSESLASRAKAFAAPAKPKMAAPTAPAGRSSAPAFNAAKASPADILDIVARAQEFDGGFAASHSATFLSVLGSSKKSTDGFKSSLAIANAGVADRVVTTLLALLVLQVKLAGDKESWADMAAKATEYITDEAGADEAKVATWLAELKKELGI